MIAIIQKVSAQFEIDVYLVLVFAMINLALFGTFLVLQKLSMIVDAISHSVLLGIILVFLVNHDLNSSWLIMGATGVGILTFYLITFLNSVFTLSSKDANIGIVFTCFFSVAIILISLLARDVHIDHDAVFLGNIELTDLHQLFKIIPLLVINVLFIIVFYKELKIVIFDPQLAVILGFSQMILNYLLITLVSLTIVISFDVVGSILTIACMIGPAASALLLTKKFAHTLLLSAWLAFVAANCGYFLGIIWDLPVASLVAVVILMIFLLVLFFAPHNGVIAKIIHNYFKRQNFMLLTLLIHLKNHELETDHNHLLQVPLDLKWHQLRYQKCLKKALKHNYIQIQTNKLVLTAVGKTFLNKYLQAFNLATIKPD